MAIHNTALAHTAAFVVPGRVTPNTGSTATPQAPVAFTRMGPSQYRPNPLGPNVNDLSKPAIGTPATGARARLGGASWIGLSSALPASLRSRDATPEPPFPPLSDSDNATPVAPRKDAFEVGYQPLSGTSMATPHVAAVVADILSINPKLKTDEVRCILIGSAVSGRLNHLQALIKAEESLTQPVDCPTKPMPDPHSTAFIPERTFSPLTQNFKNPLQAKMAASTYANAHNVVASVQRNHLAVVPKQVMIRVNDTLAKQSFEKISDYLNHGMDDCQGDNCHPRLRVTGQISPTTFVATVERDPVSPNPSTPSGSNNVGPSAGELQANAMKMVCDTLPHCPGVTAIEADVIFPVLSDIPTSADMITLQQNENTPSDPLRPKQWGLDSPDQFGIGTDAAKAFQKSRGYPTPREAGIHIGVGDTGCGVHPDMEEIFLPGRRFDRSNYPADDAIDRTTSVSHGVHVAGTAGAITGNNIGIEGVTDAKILPAKVLSDQGSGSLVDIILGIRWMAGLDIDGRTRTSTPARVINLSLGYEDACSQFLQDTINEATEKGVVVVVAAGNSNIDAGRDCPSNCRNVITVGAHDPAGKRAEFSNFGPIVDVYAPGVNILAPTHRKVKTPPPSEKPNRPDHRSPNSPNSPNSPQNPNIEPPKDENQSGEAKKKPWWLLHNT